MAHLTPVSSFLFVTAAVVRNGRSLVLLVPQFGLQQCISVERTN